MAEVVYGVNLGLSGRMGWFTVTSPKLDTICDKCHDVHIVVLTADTSGGEQRAMALCRPCIDSLFEGLERVTARERSGKCFV